MKKIRSSSSILLTSVSILSLVSIALAAFVMTSSHHDFTIQFVDKDESGTIAVDDDSIDAKFQVFSSSKLGRFSKDIGITYTANADYTITSPISLKWEATLPENFEDYFDVTATRGTLLADSQDDSVATFTLPSTSLGAKIKDAVTFEEAREQFSSDSIKLSFTTVQEDVETTISLDKTNIELKVGEEEQLTATVNPESNVAFSSEDNEIASVGAYGLVHANSVGETYIVATANGVSARCKVTVTDDTLDYVTQNFQHEFSYTDISNTSGGTGLVNGLNYSYTAASYLGRANGDFGVQIGSSNNPQTSPFTLTFNFGEEVILKELAITIGNATNGSGHYAISYDGGATVLEDDFAHSNAVSEHSFTDLNNTISSLSLSLTADAKALYLKDVSMTVDVPSDSSLKLSTDNNQGSGGDVEGGIVPGQGDVASLKYSLIPAEQYYQNIDFGADKDTLVSTLHERINEGCEINTYGEARYMLIYTDEAIDNPGHIYGIYDGCYFEPEWDQGATWNREHVWPKSKLGGASANNNSTNLGTDLHNLRASCSRVNSSRSNEYFGESAFFPNITSGFGSDHEYQGDFRGDVARICFYMYLKNYPDLTLSDNPTGDYAFGYLSDLLEWNKADPVDDFEKQRNDRIYCYQQNRNPFIDHPEIADIIF